MKKALSVILSAVIVLSIGFFTGKKTQEIEITPAYSGNSEEAIEALETDVQTAEDAAEKSAENPVNDNKGNAFGYVVVTDTIPADGKTDVADAIQALIDANPNRTIYFPDGVYLISHPIYTPADPAKSVDLQLSNYALIRASADFEGEALVILGGKDAKNDTHTVGSNYALEGGILDGSGKTNGVVIAGGRETAVRQVSIKHTIVGIHVKYGANSGSSDADINDVNIIGTGGTNSIGVVVEGWDNTFTNMRIGNVFIGFYLKTSANCLTNIHPLYYSDYTDYENSAGFVDEGGNNIYNFCYSDQFGNAFVTKGDVSSIYDNCFCYWYSEAGHREVAFKADKFNSVVDNLRCGFRYDTRDNNHVLITERSGGIGEFDTILVENHKVGSSTHTLYKEGSIYSFFAKLFA